MANRFGLGMDSPAGNLGLKANLLEEPNGIQRLAGYAL